LALLAAWRLGSRLPWFHRGSFVLAPRNFAKKKDKMMYSFASVFASFASRLHLFARRAVVELRHRRGPQVPNFDSTR